MGMLGKRLKSNGARVTLSSSLVARSSQGTIRVSPVGLCWAAFDPADAILPIMPQVIATAKERIAMSELRSMYFSIGRAQGRTTVRFRTRLEASALWDALRAAGECGLSPDEHAAVSRVLKLAGGRCSVLTNFPFEGASPRIRGGKQYYTGRISSAEAASTLSLVGVNSLRSSYIPRDAILTFDHRFSPTGTSLASLFGDLGEWCFYTPS